MGHRHSSSGTDFPPPLNICLFSEEVCHIHLLSASYRFTLLFEQKQNCFRMVRAANERLKLSTWQVLSWPLEVLFPITNGAKATKQNYKSFTPKIWEKRKMNRRTYLEWYGEGPRGACNPSAEGPSATVRPFHPTRSDLPGDPTNRPSKNQPTLKTISVPHLPLSQKFGKQTEKSLLRKGINQKVRNEGDIIKDEMLSYFPNCA